MLRAGGRKIEKNETTGRFVGQIGKRKYCNRGEESKIR